MSGDDSRHAGAEVVALVAVLTLLAVIAAALALLAR